MNVVLRAIAGPLAGREFEFDHHTTLVVGRSAQAQLPILNDDYLSRHHFLIEFNPPCCFLKDLGSTNGTQVNGLRVSETRLNDGDVIEAGASKFTVLIQHTWAEIAKIQCAACGRMAPADMAVAARPGDEAIRWLCDACRQHARKFPTPPEGYFFEKKIGEGGMGEVYKARRLADNLIVAVKMMTPMVAASDRAKSYFMREMEVMKNLRHPNIVAYYGMTLTETQFQLIMEYVDGTNAADWGRGLFGERMPVPTAARLGIKLLSALEHAHSKGFVHRDIKPANLLVLGSPQKPMVKLTDFGLAKSFRDNAGFAGMTYSTVEGSIGGSIGFLSPDHIRGFSEVKEASDLYGAGATLYYLLTGHYPYLDFNPNRANALTMILEHPSVPLRVHRPDAPEALDRALRKALEKDPADRWASASAMALALRPFLDGGP